MLCKGSAGGAFSTGGRGGGGRIGARSWLVCTRHDSKQMAFEGRNQCVRFLNLGGFTTVLVQLMEERFWGFLGFFKSKFFMNKT